MSLAISAAKGPQGDPGLFGFLGSAIKTVTGVATSFIPGPAGAIARGLQSKIFGRGQATQAAPMAATPRYAPSVMPVPPSSRTMPSVMNGVSPQRVQERQAPPTTNGFQMPSGTVGVDATPAIGCPQGYKPNKSGYYRTIKSPGNPAGGVFYIQPGSRCVKIRRRNAANPRAADRAIGRIKSAKRFATKMSSVTIRKTCGCKSRSRK